MSLVCHREVELAHVVLEHSRVCDVGCLHAGALVERVALESREHLARARDRVVDLRLAKLIVEGEGADIRVSFEVAADVIAITESLGELEEQVRIVARQKHVEEKVGFCDRDARHIKVKGKAKHCEAVVFNLHA